MNIVFNELSISHIAGNKDEAKEWMSIFFKTRDELSERIHKEVYIDSIIKLKEIIISENYTIGEWIQTLIDRDYLRKIVNILSHNPLKISYPYYYHLGKSCGGLGVCVKESSLAISYPFNNWDDKLTVEIEFFDEKENVIKNTVIIKN